MQPSEQLGALDSCVGVMCGVFADAKGIPELKQYKNTPNDERALIADEIGTKMTELQVRSIGCIAHFREIERFGLELLDSMPEKVAKKVGKQFKFGRRKIGEKVATVMPWYAVALSVIALKSAPWAQQYNQEKILLIIDNLPGNSSDSIEFLRRMNHHPEICPAWKECEENYNVKFTIANMESFQNDQAEMDIPDNHHAMIFADWLAHSIFAAANDVSLLDKPAVRDEHYKSKIASIWAKLHEAKLAEIIPIQGISVK